MIKRAFTSALDSYDRHCLVQAEVASLLVRMLKRKNYSCALELGAGTGVCTEKTIKKIMPDIFYIQDISLPLLQSNVAKHSKGIAGSFVADFDVPLFKPRSLALIVSNMALHWTQDPPCLFAGLNKQLSNRGELLFSVPVEGTFKELDEAYRQVFYAKRQWEAWLQGAGFYIKDHAHLDQTFHYPSVLVALKSIKGVGAHYYAQRDIKGLRGRDFLDRVYCGPGLPSLSYRMVCFKAIKR
jgi:trans-aconitate methyltransferase